jgi:hypothetical protein
MLAAVVCERYGWTWHEYQEQPWPFLSAIIEKLKAEGEEAQRQARRHKG